MTVNQVNPSTLESLMLYKMDSTQTSQHETGSEKIDSLPSNEDQVRISQEAKDMNQKSIEDKEAIVNGQVQAADDMRSRSKTEEDLAMEKTKEEKATAEEIYQREMMAKQSSQITNIYSVNNETTALGSTVDNIA